MFKHLLKLIWNRKKTNGLLIFEFCISFLVLFAVLSVIFYNGANYFKPLGFDYENVWVLSMSTTDFEWKESESYKDIVDRIELIKNELKNYSEIESITVCRNVPFEFGSYNTRLTYNDKKVRTSVIYADQSYKNVMNFKIIQGEWLSNADFSKNRIPIVINKAFKEEVFGGGIAIGEKFTTKSEKEYIVRGVIDEFRIGSEFSSSDNLIIRLNPLTEIEERPGDRILIKMKDEIDIAFQSQMMKKLSPIGQDWILDLDSLDKLRIRTRELILIPLIAMSIICGFLLINVSLGLFGVLWYNISKRIPEIGLRRSLGATKEDIYIQIVSETAILTGFGITIGLFFAIQFPLLDVFDSVENIIYIYSICVSIGIILIISIICAIYPSKLASKIQPAIALHNE
ncbi:MAG: hypothetical protein DWQ06_03375 [Calditrichaeota bacterium]|nr:MAG: hypothetical protein DWQ06_03375 [Calditrichota bacterium]